jgi:circadian clock protein KaiB
MSDPSSAKLYKGIALFTPGGDLIYSIDPQKRSRWHINLCIALQEMLGLLEAPHFLVPCFTATIDRWLDPYTGELRVVAEAYPPVLRYQGLLNAVFETKDLVWQVAPCPEGLCDLMMLKTYQNEFSELWQDHDLIVRYENTASHTHPIAHPFPNPSAPFSHAVGAEGYVLRLFVSGHNAATERILKNLYQMLEHFLHYPYTLKVIDIFKHPEEAEADQISATPTLVKAWPQPTRRIVGDLDDVDKILRILGSP